MAEKPGNEKTWIVSLVLCFLLCFMQMTMAVQDENTVTIAKELEAKELLKKLNKPAVKSIKSPDGDMIDCVHILNQPAFDHPKLKNHKIQMRPTFDQKRSNFSKSNPTAQLWHQSGNCPKGTIPIRRTTKDDILRAHSIQQFGKKINHTIPDLSGSLYQAPNGHEYAVADVGGDRYYGGQASVSIWKPNVQQSNEFSLSQIWILNGDDTNNLESIEAGWQIYPDIYGDYNPRLFVYWTSDSYRSSGCYNLGCSGFVQVDNSRTLGGSLQSSVEGGTQNELSIIIKKDQGSGNWWMQIGNTRVGYWPASLYNHMSEGASNVQWGGEIINWKSDGQHTTTGMGSGNFPQEGSGKASYFKGISVVNRNNDFVSPNNYNTIITNSKCYDISQYAHSDDGSVYFFYGGPGRNPECP